MSEQPSRNKSEDKSIQQRVEQFFVDAYGGWGVYLATYPCRIFWLSFLFFILLAAGMARRETYAEEKLIWTPSDNPSLKANERIAELFPSKNGFLSIIGEVKNIDSASPDNIVTLEAMKELDEYLLGLSQVETKLKSGKMIKFQELCTPGPRGVGCRFIGSPLDFATGRGGAVDLSQFKNDDSLLREAFRKGSLRGKVVPMEQMFGGVIPDPVGQDKATGENKIESAQSLILSATYVKKDEYDRKEIDELLADMQEFTEENNSKTKRVNFYLWTTYGLMESFREDMGADLALVQVSISLVAIYCIFMMGSCSPLHFRSAAAGIALLCVGLSYGASFGLAHLVGMKSAGVHQVLPFLLIGIGVDDCFVIASSLDQTDPRKPIKDRMREGMIHAGSSVTITSVTNAIAFFLGCSSSLEALSSFCFFAGLGILMLFLTSISVFSAFMVWELERTTQQKGDCCGACTWCCKPDTVICCRGSCLTPKQKAWPFGGNENDKVPEDQYTGATHRFLHQTYSKHLTSKPGIITVLVVWLIYFGISIYGVTNVEIDFKITYFISPEAYINEWMMRSEKYFKRGQTVNLYVDNPNLDYASVEVQKQIIDLNKHVMACTGCEQQWVVKDTMNSWYNQLRAFAKQETQSTPVSEQIRQSGKQDGQSKSPCTGAYIQEEVLENSYVDPTMFNKCHEFWLTKAPQYRGSTIKKGGKIVGFKESFNVISVNSAAKEGVQLLNDMRALTDKHGLEGTFTFSERYFDYESYVVFDRETITNVGLALAAVFVIMFIFTANFIITIFVLLCVILVDVFIFGLLSFWDITLNSVTVVNIVIAIGLSVDYSAHIAHAYLAIKPPKEITNAHEQRVYKARGALGMMGTSVFHGAFSTFLAIVVLSPSKSYIFKSFFRMWFGIIVFGVANGFVLLPVLLSLCGPLNEVVGHEVELADHKQNQVSDEDVEKKQVQKHAAKLESVEEPIKDEQKQ